MTETVSFSRRTGGYVVSLNGTLCGMILSPEHSSIEWRFISQWGDLSTYPTLFEAKDRAAHAVLIDHHYG